MSGQRMCMHTWGGNTNDGYRCGAKTSTATAGVSGTFYAAP